MLQQEKAEDFVIATGKQHSVREFVELAAKEVGIEILWKGSDTNEKGYNKATGQCIVEVDPRYFRPTEVETLLGDASKAKEQLGWIPKISFDELVTEMMREALKEAQRQRIDNITKNKQTTEWNSQISFHQFMRELMQEDSIEV